jgi:hypothetical protein
LAFPYHGHLEPTLLERFALTTIALDILLKFPAPEQSILFRHRRTNAARMPVPKATVDTNRKTPTPICQIRAARKRAHIAPEEHAVLPKKSRDREFRRGILSANRSHYDRSASALCASLTICGNTFTQAFRFRHGVLPSGQLSARCSDSKHSSTYDATASVSPDSSSFDARLAISRNQRASSSTRSVAAEPVLGPVISDTSFDKDAKLGV